MLAFSSINGQTAYGRVVSSSDREAFAPGDFVSLTLLPYDMAVLKQGSIETTLCGPDYGDLAPESLFKTFPCGA